jgi:hypothetical protein
MTSVELGVKVSASTSGSVTGVRFWKDSINTGTHIGSLWGSTGQLLASATFANETASGWQEVLFSQPVQITAGTTYVASYTTISAIPRPTPISRCRGPAGLSAPPLSPACLCLQHQCV